MAIQRGTGFTNLNRIMQANKGNKLGQTVSGGIQGQVSGVQSKVKSAQEQFQEEAQKNRLDTQEASDKRGEILGRFAPASGTSTVQPVAGTQQAGVGTNQTPAATQSPVSDDEIKDFTKFRTGTYAGPKELQDVGSLYGKAQQTEALGGLSRSEGGRQELLRRFVGGNNYTQGQKQLDATLLGQKPGELSSAARQARGATNLVEGANTQASNLAQEYANRAKAFGEETTQKISETKNPLSADLDKRLTEAQTAETKRVDDLKKIQDLLVGDNADYKNLDQWTRSGLALQDAANAGYLKDPELNMLLGSGDKVGLLQRGANLGLNMNQLLNERLKNTNAENLARTGVAGDEDVAKLNALDRLSGKQGTDLEFLEGRGKYAAGSTGLDIDSLEEYISKSEAEKARSDAAYAEKLAAEQARYLNKAMLGGQTVLGGAIQTAGAGLNQVLNPESYYNPTEMGGNIANAIQGGTSAAQGMQQFAGQGSASVLEGLTKLNVGGQSLANTEGGRQLLKAIDLYSKANQGISDVYGAAGSGVAGSISDLSKGNIAGALGKAINTPLNVAKSIGSSVGGATKSVKKKIKKLFSDEDLKEDIEYDPKDVQKFMDRLKPAAYDYKDEVKDNPLASNQRELGVMAQDLEKSDLGKDAVEDTKIGKVVDYDNLQPKMLASIAALNRRLKELESK